MPLRNVKVEWERTQLLRFLGQQKLPFSVDIISTNRRSVAQNRLQRLWLQEVAEQLGDRSAEEVRGYQKLHIGVPILRHENEGFRVKYDAVIRPMPYAQKLELMMVPLDLPITRIMTVAQKTTYLEKVHQHWSEQGLALTAPPDNWRKAA